MNATNSVVTTTNDEPKKPKGLTRQQWFTLFVIGSVHFASAICVSLQAPFYPQEIDVIGAKTLLNSAVVVAGLSVIAFGLIGYIDSHGWFISLSFIIRIVEALGAASSVTAAFAITAAAFPDNVATTFATLEIFYGMGYIAGPSIGGCLYSLGGYVPPFLVMGSALLLDGLVVYFVLPSFKRNDVESKGKFKELLKVPAVFIDAFSVMSASICLGFYSATLEPHIREFKLSPAILGLIFIINGTTYAATAPFVGMLCDRKFNPKVMILLGSIFMILSVFLVGPAPFFPFNETLPLVIVGLVLEGFGMSCIVVSAFIDALRSSVAGGFPDDITTYGLMSGFWSASFSLGDFIGPSVAGVLNDWMGFRYGSLFIVIVHIALFMTLSIYLLKHRKKTVYPISTLPKNAIEEHINPCVILEENYIKTNGVGYGTIEKKQEDCISRF
ncbi:hypothetical protein RUM43_001105 [Polyplax serrata]|uniref:Major facilitator superfamily (MFS) profile domain-containing protein n=1 Tax=Polyplax serrata TaxID=468196 RepID=A0AAN8XTB6_POLSC